MKTILFFISMTCHINLLTAQRNYFSNHDSILLNENRNAPRNEGEQWESDLLRSISSADSLYELYSSSIFIRKRTKEAATGAYFYNIEIGNYYFTPQTHPFIQLKLPSSLKAGCTYYFSCKVMISDHVKNSTKQVYLGYSEIRQPKAKLIKESIHKIKQIPFNLTYPKHSKKWQDWKESFVATGEERYMFIGNLFPDEEPKSKNGDTPSGFPWLVIDDIKLYTTDTDCDLNEDSILKVPTIQTFLIKGTNYDIGEYEVNENFKIYLDSISVLIKSASYRIEINGYTDSIGNESKNIKLSKARADAIKNYFILKGIDEFEIKSEGKGSSNALENKKMSLINRRVEIILIKKN